MMLKNDLKLTYIFSFWGMVFLLSSCGSASFFQNQKERKSLSADELFMEGQQMKLQHHPQKAIHYFKEFEKKKPKVATTYFEIARQYNMLKKEDSVFKYAQKAALLDTANKWIQQFYAQTLANQREFGKAAKIFHKLSRDNFTSNHFLIQEMMMWSYDEKYEKALLLVDSLEDLVGTNEQIILQKQWLYFKMNKLDSVEKEVEKLVALQPSNGKYYALLAQVYSKIDKPHKAIKVYQYLLRNQPDNVYAKLALSVLYKKTKQTVKFRKYIKEVFLSPEVDIEEKIDFVHPFLKYVEVDTSEKKDAIWLSQLLTKAYPENAATYILSGQMYYKCKKKDSALMKFKKALSIDSSDYEVWRGMMLIYLEKEKMSTLLKVNRRALRIFPQNAEVIMIRGMAYYRLKNYKKAASFLQQALDLDVKNGSTKRMLYRSLAAVYFRLHKINKAKKYKKMADEIEEGRRESYPHSPLK